MARLQTLKGASGPLSIEFTSIAAGTWDTTGEAPWNQSGVAIVKETAALVQLQRAALAAFKGAEAAAAAPTWAPPLLQPHCSLAYGNKPDVLPKISLPPPFVAEEIAIWSAIPATLEGVPSWKHIQTVKL